MAAPRAIVFDVFGTLLDTTRIADKLRGRVTDPDGLARLWREKEIEYMVLSTAAVQDMNFHRVSLEALDYALAKTGLRLDEPTKDELVSGFGSSPAFEDARSALEALSARFPLGALTNGSERATYDALAAAGLDVFFKWIRSANEVKRFKPSPSVYELVLHSFHGHAPEEILYVSAHPWDVAGAGLFGFSTARILRTEDPDELFGPPPEIRVKSPGELAARVPTRLAA